MNTDSDTRWPVVLNSIRAICAICDLWLMTQYFVENVKLSYFGRASVQNCEQRFVRLVISFFWA